MNWAALFGFLTSAVDFCGKLIGKNKDAAAAADAADAIVDAPAARAGTEAGAAATRAGRAAGKERKP